MHNYREALLEMYAYPEWKDNRTGVPTTSKVGVTLRYDLSRTFPVVTTKKLFYRGVVEELLWFLRGETNVKPLQEVGVHIWDEWAAEDGGLGPVYGKQWRDFGGVDQIQGLLDGLYHDPYSRRHIVSAWNVGELSKMALPPCHLMFQCIVTPISLKARQSIALLKGYTDDARVLNSGPLMTLAGVPEDKLSMVVTQRSADMFLGVPFNLASYATLTLLLARCMEMHPGDLVWNGGDCHIYKTHMEAIEEQLDRDVRPAPSLDINLPDVPRGAPLSASVLAGMTSSDFTLRGYNPHPAIRAPVAV